ncbi:MAG: PEP-CTERM sorting domain-containing protein [Fimbriimonadaceae bacterium]|nr:PEP-CTERM sorting domain-containing protein [Fimbriimonadaceae bacterium]
MKGKLTIAAMLIVAGSVANAQLTGNLYLEQADDVNGPGGLNFVNQAFGDFPDFSTGVGNVVTFGSAVNLSDVQIRYTDSGSWTSGNAPASAWLTISMFSGSPSSNHDPVGASAGGDIMFSGAVAGSVTNISGSLFNYVADATGVTNLAAGTYLVSLVPIADFGVAGQAFILGALNQSADSYARNPGGGFGFPAGTAWDTLTNASGNPGLRQAGMGINGQAVPEPASMVALGLGALAMVRRRRNK